MYVKSLSISNQITSDADHSCLQSVLGDCSLIAAKKFKFMEPSCSSLTSWFFMVEIWLSAWHGMPIKGRSPSSIFSFSSSSNMVEQGRLFSVQKTISLPENPLFIYSMVTPLYNKIRRQRPFFYIEPEGKYRKTSSAFAFTNSGVQTKHDTVISTYIRIRCWKG